MPVTFDKLLGKVLFHGHDSGDIGGLDTKYLKLTGGTMTGGLTIEPDTDTLTALVVNDTDSNNVLTVDTINNRVGIGTTGPVVKLDVWGVQATSETDFTPSSVLRLTRDIAYVGGRYPKDSAVDFMLSRWQDAANYPQTRLDFKLSGQPNDNDTPSINVMSIRSDGNVGIGTTGPISNTKLDVRGRTTIFGGNTSYTFTDSSTGDNLILQNTNGFAKLRIIANPASGSEIYFNSHSGHSIEADWGRISYSHPTNYMAFSTNANEQIRIDSSGNVGIGTTSPTEKLDINSDAIRIRTAQTPASAGAAGNQGDICWDANFIYICTSTNTWKKASIATW